ncbi:hypothetical protein [Mycobacteroides abscessus]|uniref:hypothetical protein n=1 Tax=Mycobacteroides abscessus TaxID=36809 RepID=UPI000C26005F|nr:hypothetical protein [Mycobacteroides abscessus]
MTTVLRPDAGAALDLLTELLRDSPALPGASCQGRGELFDGNPEYMATAVQLCHTCPAFGPCGAWADRQPRHRLSGIVAGQRRS